MISWPFFNQGEELSASKLRRLVKGCRELEQLAKSCRLQNGVGYTFNRGLGGTSLTIRPTGGEEQSRRRRAVYAEEAGKRGCGI